MPSTDVFDKQEQDYRDNVLPPSVKKRIAIEAATSDFWYKYVGFDGRIIGMETFGISAPGKIIFEHFGFTVSNIINTAKAML
jgi:transketolase